MNQSVGPEHVREPAAKVQRSPIEIVAPASVLGNHQRPSRYIPGVRGVSFEECVDTTGRHVGQAQGRRAKPWCPTRVGMERHDATPVPSDLVGIVGLQPGADQRLRDDKRVTADMIRTGNAGFWSAAVGTPDDVIAALQPLARGAMGRITQFLLQFRHAGMNNADTHRSMRLFADHVLPALA